MKIPKIFTVVLQHHSWYLSLADPYSMALKKTLKMLKTKKNILELDDQ